MNDDDGGVDGMNVGPFSWLAINTDHGACTAAARHVMVDFGGSAVDGAIAALLCIGVVNLFSSGLGGGGFMLVGPSTAASLEDVQKRAILLDFRERAPLKAREDMFLKAPANSSTDGPLAVATPGELLGFWHAKQRFPSAVSWRDLFSPAIDLARRGFPLHERLHNMATLHVERIRKFADLSRLLLDSDGAVKSVGTMIRRENLARTLEQIAEHGPSVLYGGHVGNRLVDLVHSLGGILTVDDLTSYRVVERPVYSSRFRGFDVVTGGQPTGGLVSAFILSILDRLPYLRSPHDPLSIHRFVEACKFGYAARMLGGDPDALPEKMARLAAQLQDPTIIGKAASLIGDRVHDPAFYQSIFPQFSEEGGDMLRDRGTAHVSIVDLRTNHSLSVSAVSSVNVAFGSLLLDPETGILLNDEMDDFSIPGNNAYDLPPSAANAIAPGKRPQSSCSPLLLYNSPPTTLNHGRSQTHNIGHEKHNQTHNIKYEEQHSQQRQVYGVIGGVGGSKIISTVCKYVVDAIDFALTPAASVMLPRWHHQLLPNVLMVEPGGPLFTNDASMIKDLEHRGHHVKVVQTTSYYSGISMLMRRRDDLLWYGSPDPRKPGGRIDGL